MADREGDTYLAAKILTIDATRRHDAGETRELEFLKEIAAREDSDFLILLDDHFVEKGPMGNHLCLVQVLCSTSVSSLRQSSPHKALPPYMVRNIISMLLDALAQLHTMRIVHAGSRDPRSTSLCSRIGTIDVKPDNLLFGNPLYYLDKDMQQYLAANPAEFEGEAQLGEESYPIFKSQPIPHGNPWNPSALVAETMLVYLKGLGHGQYPTCVYSHTPHS
jgi:serine/threonine-protein kinase SRPK3